MPYTTAAGAPTMDDAETLISGTSGVQVRSPFDDAAHQPVAKRRFGTEPEVPVGVLDGRAGDLGPSAGSFTTVPVLRSRVDDSCLFADLLTPVGSLAQETSLNDSPPTVVVGSRGSWMSGTVPVGRGSGSESK